MLENDVDNILTQRITSLIPLDDKEVRRQAIGKAALELIVLFAKIVKEAGEIPSGHLYAMVMDKLTLEQYQVIISKLKGADLVVQKNHLLVWSRSTD